MKKIMFIFTFVGSFLLSISTNTFAADLFSPPMDYAAGNGPVYTAVGDFNADGKPDIASANGDFVSIFIGNGDGTFQAKVDYATYRGVCAIVVGDFNNDGKADLAATVDWGMYSENAVSIIITFLGNGDGTFQPMTDYRFFIGRLYSIVKGDFNNDGKTDIAGVHTWLHVVSIFLGNGDGTFQGQNYYPTAGYPYSISTDDFNGDGIADLATASYYWAHNVSVLIGNMDGSFQTPLILSAGGSGSPNSIVTGDFNGDGKKDIATINDDSTTISILIGNNDGTFQPKVDYLGNNPFLAITVGDFNVDGKMDIATGNYNGSVSIFIGYGDGTFMPSIDYPTGGNYLNNYISTGDFNKDNKTDIVTANGYYNTISILLNIANFANRSPLANAGLDQIIEGAPSGASVTLDGSGSSDPDGDSLRYRWTWPGGSAEGVNPIVSLPLGTTSITLTVNDGQVTANDTVNIIIRDDDDLDQDGYGIATDCNDTNASIFPGAVEIPYNGIDENCNGMIDDDDLDYDGYSILLDCNDNAPNIYPNATEIKFDNIDQDCNNYDLTINIIEASYNSRTKILTIAATSSLNNGAALAVVGFGSMSWNSGLSKWTKTVTGVQSNPGSATVTGIEGSTSLPITVQ